MSMVNKTFLVPNDPYNDSFVSFYFDDNENFSSYGLSISDGGPNTIKFSGDTKEDLACLEQLLSLMNVFYQTAKTRLANKNND